MADLNTSHAEGGNRVSFIGPSLPLCLASPCLWHFFTCNGGFPSRYDLPSFYPRGNSLSIYTCGMIISAQLKTCCHIIEWAQKAITFFGGKDSHDVSYFLWWPIIMTSLKFFQMNVYNIYNKLFQVQDWDNNYNKHFNTVEVVQYYHLKIKWTW